MWASHGTVPWSPAPASALRGEGRERGAQRDEFQMPTGRVGVRFAAQAGMALFRDSGLAPSVGDMRQTGEELGS